MTSVDEIISNCVKLSENPNNQFFELWSEIGCHQALTTKISQNVSSNTVEYNPDNQATVENAMTDILNNYSQFYEFTDDTSSNSYSNFQYELLSICIDTAVPGVCDTFLNSYCSDVSREQATNDRFLTSLCGCYVPPDPTYLQYTTGNEECLEGLPGCQACQGDGCFGQPACDPLCHRALTIQKANKDIGSIISCPQNVCVIDETNASVGNNSLSFINVCTGCQEGDGCICVVNTPDDLSDNVYSLCGPDSVYIENGEVVDEPALKVNTKTKITWGVVLIATIVLISVITYLLLKHGENTRRLSNRESTRSQKT